MNTLRSICAVILGSASVVMGQGTAITPAVGYEKLEARGLSDTYFGIPLVKRPILTGRVDHVTAHAITISPTTGWEQVVTPADGKSYYLQFVTGNLAGLCLRIIGADGSALVLDCEGEDLTAPTLGSIETGEQGDLVRVRPAWDLADLFGDTPATLKLEPVSHLSDGPYTEGDAVLTSLASLQNSLAYYVSNDGWRSSGDPSTDAGKINFLPGAVFGVRRHGPAAAEILVIGDVPVEPVRLQIPASSAETDVEISVSLAHPWSTSLAEAGLFFTTPEESILAPALSVLDGGDLLFEWGPDRVGMALPPKSRFHVVGVSWYDVALAADDQLLQPGRGYVLRLRAAHGRRYWLQPGLE